MSDRRTPAKRTISLSVILGTLLVPLSAVAALVLTDTAEPSSDAAASTTTTSMTVPTSQTQTSVQASGLNDDLAEACGAAGMELVNLELEESLTEIQQAALDALREVCDQEGMPLPLGPTPEPIIETVLVSDGADETTTPTLPGYEDSDDDYDEHEYEFEEDDDHDEDDDRYEDDDHDEDDDHHEDDDHEEG